MRIGVIGNGVVGSATARTYLEHCEEVRVWDLDPARRVHDEASVMQCDLVFICLPEAALEGYSLAMPNWARKFNFVLKSTVPIGTTRRLREKHGLTNLVHSPEFLTARCSFVDAQCPARNIIGIPQGHKPLFERNEADSICFEALNVLYHTRFPGVPVQIMSSDESEAVKLFTNAFFATKVAFFCEVHQLVTDMGLDWERVRAGVLSDGRIAHSHTQVPGPDGKVGFGGRCLPKDLRMLVDEMDRRGMNPSLFKAVLEWAHG